MKRKQAIKKNYWLRLSRDSGLIKDKSFYDEVVDAIDESDHLKRNLTKIVITSQLKPATLNTRHSTLTTRNPVTRNNVYHYSIIPLFHFLSLLNGNTAPPQHILSNRESQGVRRKGLTRNP